VAKRLNTLRLTSGGWVLALLTFLVCVAAFNSGINLLFLMAALLLSLVAVSLLVPWIGLRAVRVVRHAPVHFYAHEPFDVHLLLQNQGAWRKRSVTAEDRIVGHGLNAAHYCFAIRVPGRTTVGRRYVACVEERGEYDFVGPSVMSRFPFGLVCAGVWSRQREPFLVYPRRGRLKERAWPFGPMMAQPVGAAALRDRGVDEFRSLREFREGDNPRQIHWRTTARRLRPYIKEMEREQMQTGALVLDTFVPKGAPPERARCLELAVSFAASVIAGVIGKGGVVGFAAFTPELTVRRALAGESGLHDALAALARLRPSPDRGVADLIREVPPDMIRGLGVLAVLMDGRSAAGVRSELPPDTDLRTFVVTDPGFEDVFALEGATGEMPLGARCSRTE